MSDYFLYSSSPFSYWVWKVICDAKVVFLINQSISSVAISVYFVFGVTFVKSWTPFSAISSRIIFSIFLVQIVENFYLMKFLAYSSLNPLSYVIMLIRNSPSLNLFSSCFLKRRRTRSNSLTLLSKKAVHYSS